MRFRVCRVHTVYGLIGCIGLLGFWASGWGFGIGGLGVLSLAATAAAHCGISHSPTSLQPFPSKELGPLFCTEEAGSRCH